MADDGSVQSTLMLPLTRFQFSVLFDGNHILFQEVAGLSTEVTPLEYRAAGKDEAWTMTKMPEPAKYSNLTLNRGTFTKGRNLRTKYSATKMNTYKRIPVIITLLDEAGESVMSWTLQNAFPSKMVFCDTEPGAIETMEIAHEGMTLSLPS